MTDSIQMQVIVEIMAKALYENTVLDMARSLNWAEMKNHYGLDYEGVRRFYERASAVAIALQNAGYTIDKAGST